MAVRKDLTAFSGSLLPEGRKRWRSFGAGLGLECTILAALIILPLLLPQQFEIVQHYWVTPLDVPVIQPWKPQPVRTKKVVVKRVVVKKAPKIEAVAPPKPQIYSPVITTPVTKLIRHKVAPAPEVVAKVLPDPKLSMGSSAVPTLRKPRPAVQTGGFGDPNGLRDNGRRDRNPNIAHVGQFNLPAGGGNGNGTNGKKGSRGVVASAGFGNGVAVSGPRSGPRGAVQQGLFASKQAPGVARVRRTAEVTNTKPVQILYVPRPVYTKEGRAKKIQGVVLLQVVFTASGEVKVQRVVQGLGYGLDEAAAKAARGIRFRPAERDGQPVDFSAIARIVFELAY